MYELFSPSREVLNMYVRTEKGLILNFSIQNRVPEEIKSPKSEK